MYSKLPLENYTASLLGGAIGDALGAPVEFITINEIHNQYGPKGITDYVEFPNNVGEFTDDTQMTLFTAEGLLRSFHRAMLRGTGGSMHQIVHDSYLRWLHTQSVSRVHGHDNKGMKYRENGWLIRQPELFNRRGPGNTCLSALQSGMSGTIINPINNSKGCGGIMRMAPVGLVFPGQNEFAFKTGCELAAITHGHPSGYLSAGFFASVISDLAIGIKLEEAIQNTRSILKNWKGFEETDQSVEKALELFRETKSGLPTEPRKLATIVEQLGAGWVGEEALSISLFCSLQFQNDFKSGIMAAVNHSGDSDSTGAITGNILGLINGAKAIPEKWITNLRANDIVGQVGEDLHVGVKGDSMNTDQEWWTKYPGA